MTNELTRVIMKNIVDRCIDNKRGDTPKIHIDNREINMLKDIIHRGNDISINRESKIKPENKGYSKRITLDELINKNVKDNKSSEKSVREKIKEPYKKEVNKLSLEDIATLTSIRKKR